MLTRNTCDGSGSIIVCRAACHVALFAIPQLAAGATRLPVALVAEVIAVAAGVKEGDAGLRDEGDTSPAKASTSAGAHCCYAWRRLVGWTRLGDPTHPEDHHNLWGKGWKLLRSGVSCNSSVSHNQD